MWLAGLSKPSGTEDGEEPWGCGTSAMPGQELFSPVEQGFVGQLMGRTDSVTGRRLSLDSGSLWLWTQSAGSAAALLSGMLWYLLEKHQKNQH